MERDIKAVILAAGKGTRMKSELPKVLLTVCGKSILDYVITACKNAGISDIYIVVGYEAEQVKRAFGGGYRYVLQESQLGTGHALLQVYPFLKNYIGDLLVLVGDCPAITADILLPGNVSGYYTNRAGGLSVPVKTTPGVDV